MLKAVIIDDEPKGRQVLRHLLEENFPEIEIAGTAENVASGVQAIRDHAPGLVFLDIEMPEANGFTLFQHFDNIDFEVIFTTAYDSYALRAIKVSALDYLLKPILLSDLQGALQKVLSSPKIKLVDRIHLFEQQTTTSKTNSGITQIALPTMSGFSIVKMADIMHIQSDGSYSVFHLAGGEQLIVSKNLKEYEDLLKDSGFFRIHHSHLINLAYVKKYIKGKTGSVVLTNGKSFDVAARRKDEFVKIFRG